MARAVVLTAAALLAAGCGSAGTPSARTPAPSFGAAKREGFDVTRLRAAERQLAETRELLSVLVMRHGRLVLDRYYRGASRDLPWSVFSVTKSVVSALVGIAIRDGRLKSTNERLVDLFPNEVSADADPQIRSITVRHLLTMTAGYRSVNTPNETDDGNSRAAKKTISELRSSILPGVQNNGFAGSAKLTLAGAAPEARDFISAVYGNFPYVILFVLLLTFVLLMRAFRSVVLPIKAVILNLVSLGAAYGIVVFIFQDGHGSDLIWNVKATDAVISWIPLMIFAFLYGISMDYEVFMLTRMRESYEETHVTQKAIELGLARTGKLVTSAALVLMFAFFSLSTGPGPDIKQFAIGLAAGIIFDATVIRALLVPSTMMLLGRWNWWLPTWTARVLRTRPSPLEPAATASAET